MTGLIDGGFLDKMCLMCFRSLSQVSVVCAYTLSAIRDIFNRGKFKTPLEPSHSKWVTYLGDVPFPRPGAVSLQIMQPEVLCNGGNLQGKDKNNCHFFPSASII